ncbi:MAG: hypothetical protein OEY23_21160 [Acidimicrobiia bacterium]|nr:hypothetical protein [Acidimicrobiia bacterium]
MTTGVHTGDGRGDVIVLTVPARVEFAAVAAAAAVEFARRRGFSDDEQDELHLAVASVLELLHNTETGSRVRVTFSVEDHSIRVAAETTEANASGTALAPGEIRTFNDRTGNLVHQPEVDGARARVRFVKFGGSV